jgi:hypothetical protein
MFKRLSIASVAALSAGLIVAASVAAATATYQDRVFRYRASPGENVFVSLAAWYDQTSSRPRYLQALTNLAPNVGPGCSVTPNVNGVEVRCVLTASEAARDIRYRFTLSDGDDFVDLLEPLSGGVVYAGPGGAVFTAPQPRPLVVQARIGWEAQSSTADRAMTSSFRTFRALRGRRASCTAAVETTPLAAQAKPTAAQGMTGYASP